MIFADWVLSAEQGQVSKQFHIEFQIANPASMIIRMFEYGFHIARESAQTKDKKVFLRYPKQLVLYNEEFSQVKRIIQSSQEHLLSIYGAEKIKEDDLNKMTTVTHNLMEHLYEKFYVYNNSFPQEVQHMLDSVLNVDALLESRKRGKIEGKIEGKVEGKIDALLKILNAKKLADEDILSRVIKEKDPDRLTRWIIAAATVNTVKDFKTAIHENE
ncbi:hypothetical protein CBW65_09235 [Tumebacillus avium]|uniref:DUF4351 domain-containing protein n=1 Tax=Tumebacillus avium TaxID=1903704 RepID=A0A1Y0IL12_9BACL|nr:hypothetical protein [Tumebacillus avium]ARU61198.1 hypothetical protein CBW65_09235 [Tumebacillus avium]